MKKATLIIKVISLCLLSLGSVSYADLYNRAPDVLPGTTLEMQEPAFWIARMKNPNEIILSPEAIQRMNEEFQKKIRTPDPFKGAVKERIPNLSHTWPGYEMVIPDLYSMKPQDIADTVRAKITNEIAYLRGRDFGNTLAVRYSKEEKVAFEHEMALELIKDDFKILSGLAVRTTLLRNVPSYSTLQVGLQENGKALWDMFTVCKLKIGKLVTVLHPSRNGEYLFVLCGDGYGWVKSEDIAFGDRKTIDSFVNSERFVVCTGDRVMFYSDESCIYASGWFGMGDHLPLAESGNTRIIKIPVRKSDGSLTTETAWLAKNADVSIGWLPYTRRNVVTTAFKLLGTVYDWTGGWYGRNHETNIRDIFACFGFELPFHGALFTHFSNTERVAYPPKGVKRGGGYALKPDKEAVQDMYKVILENEPFITITSVGGNGHTQLLLGEYEGEPYVFDLNGYGYTDEDGTVYEIRRTVVANMGMGVPGYTLTNPIIFCELK